MGAFFLSLYQCPSIITDYFFFRNPFFYFFLFFSLKIIYFLNSYHFFSYYRNIYIYHKLFSILSIIYRYLKHKKLQHCWSYISKWWSRSESNQRHKDFQSFALPTELRDHLVAGEGFEPTTSGLWARRATRLLYPAISDGGGTGIRTQAPVSRPTGFQDRTLQPLGYSSLFYFGGPCRTRTYDPPVMSRMLWPTELRVHFS